METENHNSNQSKLLNTIGEQHLEWYTNKCSGNKIYALVKLYTITNRKCKRHDRRAVVTSQ